MSHAGGRGDVAALTKDHVEQPVGRTSWHGHRRSDASRAAYARTPGAPVARMVTDSRMGRMRLQRGAYPDTCTRSRGGGQRTGAGTGRRREDA
jgi:hypothetical protein